MINRSKQPFLGKVMCLVLPAFFDSRNMHIYENFFCLDATAGVTPGYALKNYSWKAWGAICYAENSVPLGLVQDRYTPTVLSLRP